MLRPVDCVATPNGPNGRSIIAYFLVPQYITVLRQMESDGTGLFVPENCVHSSGSIPFFPLNLQVF